MDNTDIELINLLYTDGQVLNLQEVLAEDEYAEATSDGQDYNTVESWCMREQLVCDFLFKDAPRIKYTVFIGD